MLAVANVGLAQRTWLGSLRRVISCNICHRPVFPRQFVMDDNWEHVVSLICADLLQNAHKSVIETKLEIAKELTLLSKEKSRSLDALTGQVNAALSTSKHRLQGLILLQSFVPQCSAQIFLDNSLSWIRLLTQTLQSYDPPLTLNLACHVTCQVLRHASTFPQLNRELSNQHIPQLVSVLLDAKPQWQAAAIQCLTCCLQTFHGPCGPFKNKIENMLLKELEGNPHENVELLSDCLAWLCQAGGGGNLGVKHVEAWTAHCDRLLVSIHHTLGLLFQGLEAEVYDLLCGDVSPLFSETSVPDEEPQRTLKILAQVTALMACLRKMITLEFPVAVPVPAADIIDLLWRIVAITDKRVLQRVATQERLLLCSVLPKLQQEAFLTLEQLIMGCQSVMAVHNATINRLFLQTLNWTVSKTREYGRERPYSSLRESVYSALTRWLQVAGASAGVETVAGDLLPHLIGDAKAEVDTIKVNSKGKKNLDQPTNTGKRKKGNQGDLGQLTTQRKISVTANSVVCRGALQALRTLLIKTGSFLPMKLHQSIQEFTVHTLLDLQQSESPPLPYACPACRRALYGVLQGCVLAPHPDWPPPTQVAVTILRTGLQDADPEVSQFCSEALVICDPIIRPRAPPLRAPLPAVLNTTMAKVDENPVQSNIMDISSGTPARLLASLSQKDKQPEPMAVEVTSKSNTHSTEPQPGTSVAPDPYETPLPESSEEEEESDEESENMEEEEEQNGSAAMETGQESLTQPDTPSESIKNKTEPLTSKISSQTDTVEKQQEHKIIEEESNVSEKLDDANVVDQLENSSKSVDTNSVSSGSGEKDGDLDKLRTNGETKQEESDLREGTKRKLLDDGEGHCDLEEEEPAAKKQEVDETDLMLASFVDAGPDSD